MERSQKWLRAEQLEARLMLATMADGLRSPALLNLNASMHAGDSFVALAVRQLGKIEGTVGISDRVNWRNRVDSYSFEVERSGQTTIRLEGLNADLDIYLSDSRGRNVARSMASGSQSETIVVDLDPGSYALRVRAFRRAASDYQLTIGHQPEESAPPAEVVDTVGNTMADARDLGALSGSMAFAESITQADQADVYRFHVRDARPVTIGLTGLSADLDVYLRDDRGRTVSKSILANSADEWMRLDLDPGEYYVSVSGYRGAVSDYSLSFEALLPDVPPVGSDPATGRDPVAGHNPGQGTGRGEAPPAGDPAIPIQFPPVAYYGGSSDWNLNAVDAPEAWFQGITGAGVTVAVVDSGVDWNHVDLVGNIWANTDEIAGDGIDNDANGYVDDIRGWDFVYNDANPDDVNGHGTHVAGTIAAGMNSFGATGVAYDATIMPVRVLGNGGSGSTRDVAEGIRYAVDNGADIINLSLGGGSSSSIRSAIEYADSQGVFVVAAAGNEGASLASYPACFSSDLTNVLSVGAHNSRNTIATFSNDDGGRAIQVDAPGVGVYSTLPDNRYGNYSGTSMATPHVAGIAALVVSASPSISNSALRNALVVGADRPIANSDSGGVSASSSLGQLSSVIRPVVAAVEPDIIETVTTMPRRGRSRFARLSIPAFERMRDTDAMWGSAMTRNLIDQVFAFHDVEMEPVGTLAGAIAGGNGVIAAAAFGEEARLA